jgi:hypothetical protein
MRRDRLVARQAEHQPVRLQQGRQRLAFLGAQQLA